MEGEATFVDHFNAANDAVREGVLDGLRAFAFALQAEVMAKITDQGLVDTGALRRSVFVEAKGISQRDEKFADAVAVAKKSSKVHEAESGAKIDTSYQAKVGVCVNYGIYLEMGTVKMAARPYMKPASDTMQVRAEQIVGKFVTAAMRKGA
jgi:HK97 gp10 family phage protein